MKRLAQGVLLVVIGLVVVGVVATGSYMTMVRPVMMWPLLATALVLLLAGVTQLLRGRRHPGHGVALVGAVLAVPFIAMVAVPVKPLASWSAQRSSSVQVVNDATFDPLPAGDVVPLNVSEFVERATFDPAASLKDRKIKLTGFVSPYEGGWAVTRIRVKCCAADATPFKAIVTGVPSPPVDSWVEVTGTWVPAPISDGKRVAPWPRMTDAQVTPIPARANPYE